MAAQACMPLALQAHQACRAGDLPRSIALHRQALALDPGCADLWANLLHVFWLADLPHQGLEAFEQACRHLPPRQRPWLNLGNLLRDLNRYEQADAVYHQAAAALDRDAPASEHAAVAWSHSQLLIGLERYDQAYALAEQRFRLARHRVWRPPPYWQGWPPVAGAGSWSAGSRGQMLLWSEQGLGDALQHLRWLPLLVQRGHQIVLEVDPPLLPLLRQGLSWLAPALSLRPKGLAPHPLPSACQGSLLSLPWLLGGAPGAAALPAQMDQEGNARPLQGLLRSPRWLSPPPPGSGRSPRVGLVWASGRKHGDAFVQRDYRRRSLSPEALQALLEGLDQAGAALVCLQYGADRQRADAWRGAFAATLADSVDLAETARWICALDLVITVDTAAAHLVGALARPGWLLLPWAADPRWLRWRSDSPWYPSLTLLRQPQPGDWMGLVQEVLQRFRSWRRLWDAP